MNRSPIISLVERHVEDGAFLWLQRDDAVSHQPHYDLMDLYELDNRLEAHLDGIAVAGETGWQIALQQAKDHQEPGEIFVVAWLAVACRNVGRLVLLLPIVEQKPDCWRAMVSALAWHGVGQTDAFTEELSHQSDNRFQALNFHASVLNRSCPEAWLARVPTTDDHLLARYLKALGEMRQSDQLGIIMDYQSHPNAEVAFWSAWAGVLLGDNQAYKLLKHIVLSESPFREKAMQLLACVSPKEELNELILALFSVEGSRSLALKGAGFSGDPKWVPGLIKYMAEPTLARVAGEAFSLITGADLAYLSLDQDQPESYDAMPSESAKDDDVELDQDEFLPWPNPEKVAAWWHPLKNNLDADLALLLGEPAGIAQCWHTLGFGKQRQRKLAATRLMVAGQVSFPTEAPASYQKQCLTLTQA